MGIVKNYHQNAALIVWFLLFDFKYKMLIFNSLLFLQINVYSI